MSEETARVELTEETPKPTKEKKPAQTAGYCCYIGPTIMGYVQKGTIYPGTKAEVLKSPAVQIATDKFPPVADLIVDGLALDESEKQVKIKGTDLYEKAKMLSLRK